MPGPWHKVEILGYPGMRVAIALDAGGILGLVVLDKDGKTDVPLPLDTTEYLLVEGQTCLTINGMPRAQ